MTRDIYDEQAEGIFESLYGLGNESMATAEVWENEITAVAAQLRKQGDESARLQELLASSRGVVADLRAQLRQQAEVHAGEMSEKDEPGDDVINVNPNRKVLFTGRHST